VRRSSLFACLATVLAFLAGCTSSGPAAKPSSGRSLSAATLAGTINTALDALTSAHLDIDTGSLGGRSTADVVLQGGKATATDVHTTEAGKAVEVLTVGGRSYAKVPGASKPWVLVSPTSSNPTAKALATSPGVTDVLTSLAVVSGIVRSAQDVQDKGSDATGHHYTMKIDPKQGTGNPKLDGMLSILGSTKIPTDLWLDGKNRPVKVALHIALGSSTFPVTVAASDFDAPLHLAAPPAADVGTG
jgi:hypothetical protein